MKSLLFAFIPVPYLRALEPILASTEPASGGLSTFGALLALGAAASLAFIGFVWYPIKRLRKKIRAQAVSAPPQPLSENAAGVRK